MSLYFQKCPRFTSIQFFIFIYPNEFISKYDDQSFIDVYYLKLKRFLRSYHAVYKDEGDLLWKLKYITSKTIPSEKSIVLV